jgi:hypothetical protein
MGSCRALNCGVGAEITCMNQHSEEEGYDDETLTTEFCDSALIWSGRNLADSRVIRASLHFQGWVIRSVRLDKTHSPQTEVAQLGVSGQEPKDRELETACLATKHYIALERPVAPDGVARASHIKAQRSEQASKNYPLRTPRRQPPEV